MQDENYAEGSNTLPIFIKVRFSEENLPSLHTLSKIVDMVSAGRSRHNSVAPTYDHGLNRKTIVGCGEEGTDRDPCLETYLKRKLLYPAI